MSESMAAGAWRPHGCTSRRPPLVLANLTVSVLTSSRVLGKCPPPSSERLCHLASISVILGSVSGHPASISGSPGECPWSCRRVLASAWRVFLTSWRVLLTTWLVFASPCRPSTIAWRVSSGSSIIRLSCIREVPTHSGNRPWQHSKCFI